MKSIKGTEKDGRMSEKSAVLTGKMMTEALSLIEEAQESMHAALKVFEGITVTSKGGRKFLDELKVSLPEGSDADFRVGFNNVAQGIDDLEWVHMRWGHVLNDLFPDGDEEGITEEKNNEPKHPKSG